MPHSAKGRRTALVVEDFTDSRRVFRQMLELRGFDVSEAADGEEAVEAARRQHPGLILMDLSLPRVDGLTAVKMIRGCGEGCGGARIIAVTAYDSPGLREAALEAGCDDYLVKPVGFTELDKALRGAPPA